MEDGVIGRDLAVELLLFFPLVEEDSLGLLRDFLWNLE